MIATERNPQREVRRRGRVEPLENGDQLGASEFLRRYEAMPEVRKAELIQGVVYMGSPVRIGAHAEPDSLLQMWLTTYAAHTPGVSAAANCTVKFDTQNVPQPDALLRLLPECGGRSHVDSGDFLTGAPELVVEISASSTSLDLHTKLDVYRRSGVEEYLTWRTTERGIDWRVLAGGEYRLLAPDAKGVLKSSKYPGLWLNVESLLKRDGAAVLATLNSGLRCRAHKAFVRDLAARWTV